MTDQTQQRIACEFLGMTPSDDGGHFDWSDRQDAPWRLPDLDTEEGAALWVAWIKGEFKRRGWQADIRLRSNGRWNVLLHREEGERLADVRGRDAELAALTAAVLAIMEANDG